MTIQSVGKLFLALTVAALVATACSKDEPKEKGSGEADGVSVLVGSCPSCKMSLGDKTGSTYPALWEKDDAIAVYDCESTSLLGTATLKSGAGENIGRFELSSPIAPGKRIKIVYPADASFSIPAEQFQDDSGKSHLETLAESGEIICEGGPELAFSLSHLSAVVKVDVSSTEFADMKLKSVLLYRAGGELAEGSDHVRLNFRSIRSLSTAQSAVFTAKANETPQDYYLAVTMAKGNKTVTIPLKYQGKTLMAGQLNLISVDGLKTSDNAVPWYNPECTRYIPEGAWCYGPANCLVVGTAANSGGTFDVRACGDFLGVIKYAREPKQLQLRLGDMVTPGNAGMWTVDGTAPKKKAFVALSNYAPDIRLAKVPQSGKQSVAGLFNLTDANQNVIWAFLIWATEPAGVNLPQTGVRIMDRNLGGSGSSAATETEQRGNLYQWGRPFPFGQTTGSATSTTAAQVLDANVRVADYNQSALKANYIACIPDGAASNDWMQTDEHKNDLWGNPYADANSAGGPKSIFDPCPQGWKVASAAAMNEVFRNATWNATANMYCYPNTSVTWPVTCFLNGKTSAQGGSTKGLYFTDNPWDTGMGLHFEYNRGEDDHPKSFQGTWRSNACAVRCMVDPDSNDAEGLPDAGPDAPYKTFTNPVISSVLPDPTIWKVGNEFRITGTGLGTAFSSKNMVSWPLAPSLPLDATELALCKAYGSQLWAPDVTVVGGKYMMYVTCYNSATNSSIVALQSEDGRSFRFAGLITSYSTNGNIKDTIDPEVVADPQTGKLWLFFGSTGRIHRVELNASGTALAQGATFTPVAGLDISQNPSRSKVYEGAYLHWHDGYWYLFASAGLYSNYTYKIVVGRSASLTGTFVDRNGAPMLEGNATVVMSSASGDVLYGPGHNAEIITDRRGQDYIFYHCHCSTLSSSGDDRYGCLQRIYWDADGWPYVTGAKPARTDLVPLF